MQDDTPPHDAEVLAAITGAGGTVDPEHLISKLLVDHTEQAVIEALQRAIERGRITLDDDGMVVPVQMLADAA